MDLSIVEWHKSRRSSEQGDQCIELAAIHGAVAVCDSKDPAGPKLLIERADFRHFGNALKNI
ncbi:DUF397 domain-containing protein [Actinomadura macrotermitis]|uniref:DUF397 domain-containing protein n=1 Tax=Actinomadura macrotermitis TaxID=2585200 RepID=A0A7K0C167_9ACTN|nr:DUF397 domain-containing protein [Actinomadura macrotermitis]MQY07187.1 hypothetical protein [Actinomadura macrotermitis]